MPKNTKLGLLAVLGIWLTAGLALPFVNVLSMFTPAQLMVLRGGVAALIVLLAVRYRPARPDKYAWAIMLVLPFATLGLYQGIRYWGAGPTLIILTTSPVINLLVSVFLGNKISRAAITGLVLMFGGVVLARWGGHFNWTGFAWSVLASVMSGVLYEFLARSKTGSMQKCILAYIGMAMLGFIVGFKDSWGALADGRLVLVVVAFAFIGGFLYWIANVVAFKNLRTLEASVLAQGETPAVILGAWLFLGEHLTLFQW
ncbi:MAG TPA: DMT family transporter, partial [Candidatus Paceibacterota bacterium]|nr:DMT family transporter [Candidatus Paceibacterota bacterium]